MSSNVAAVVERLKDHAKMYAGVSRERVLEAVSTIKAQAAEIERLRELFRIDGEQHATRIREMEKAHDARIAKYYEALEAERAKLRAAVEMIRRWHMADLTGHDGSLSRARQASEAFLATMEKTDEQ